MIYEKAICFVPRNKMKGGDESKKVFRVICRDILRERGGGFKIVTDFMVIYLEQGARNALAE